MSINKDLAAERGKSTFDTEDLTSVLYGKDGMHRRRLACKQMLHISWIYRGPCSGSVTPSPLTVGQTVTLEY